METRLLKYFLAIALEESITRAALSLNITQPTLSRQMIGFERQLGVTLFIRNKNKILLTAEGAFLKKRAQEIIDIISRTEIEISDLSKALKAE